MNKFFNKAILSVFFLQPLLSMAYNPANNDFQVFFLSSIGLILAIIFFFVFKKLYAKSKKNVFLIITYLSLIFISTYFIMGTISQIDAHPNRLNPTSTTFNKKGQFILFLVTLLLAVLPVFIGIRHYKKKR